MVLSPEIVDDFSGFQDSPVLRDIHSIGLGEMGPHVNELTQRCTRIPFLLTEVKEDVKFIFSKPARSSQWVVNSSTLSAIPLLASCTAVLNLALGFLLSENLASKLGPTECVSATFLSQLSYSVLGFLPTGVLRTSPLTVFFVSNLGKTAQFFSLEVISFVGWTGVWAAASLILIGAINFTSSWLQYSSAWAEISDFSMFVFLLYEVYRLLNDIFSENESSTGMVALWLATGTWALSSLILTSKKQKSPKKSLRDYLPLYAPMISLILFTAVQGVPYRNPPPVARLNYPAKAWLRSDSQSSLFSVNSFLSTPKWAFMASALPGVSLAMLVIKEHIRMVKALKEEYGTACSRISYSSDFFLLGMLTLFCSVLGFPFISSWKDLSLSHSDLTSILKPAATEHDGESALNENQGHDVLLQPGRVSGVLSSILAACLILPYVTKIPSLIPQGVLIGILLQMAFGSLSDSNFSHRFGLLISSNIESEASDEHSNNAVHGNLQDSHPFYYTLLIMVAQVVSAASIFGLYFSPFGFLFPLLLCILEAIAAVCARKLKLISVETALETSVLAQPQLADDCTSSHGYAVNGEPAEDNFYEIESGLVSAASHESNSSVLESATVNSSAGNNLDEHATHNQEFFEWKAAIPVRQSQVLPFPSDDDVLAHDGSNSSSSTAIGRSVWENIISQRMAERSDRKTARINWELDKLSLEMNSSNGVVTSGSAGTEFEFELIGSNSNSRNRAASTTPARQARKFPEGSQSNSSTSIPDVASLIRKLRGLESSRLNGTCHEIPGLSLEEFGGSPDNSMVENPRNVPVVDSAVPCPGNESESLGNNWNEIMEIGAAGPGVESRVEASRVPQDGQRRKKSGGQKKAIKGIKRKHGQRTAAALKKSVSQEIGRSLSDFQVSADEGQKPSLLFLARRAAAES